MAVKTRKTLYLDRNTNSIFNQVCKDPGSVSTANKLIIRALTLYFSNIREIDPEGYHVFNEGLKDCPFLLDHFKTLAQETTSLKNKNNNINDNNEGYKKKTFISDSAPEIPNVKNLPKEIEKPKIDAIDEPVDFGDLELEEPISTPLKMNRGGGKQKLFMKDGMGTSITCRGNGGFTFYDVAHREAAGPNEILADSDYAARNPHNVRSIPGDSLLPDGVAEAYDSNGELVDLEAYYAPNRDWLGFLAKVSPLEHAEYLENK